MLNKNHISNKIKLAYFIGVGGIGMSALARYYNSIGVKTLGYDKTPSSITESLISEGIEIHFEDDINLVLNKLNVLKKEEVIVVYTPAVPSSHSEFQWFKANNYKIYKRAEVLGLITNEFKTSAVAGTHGKTSVSTIIAHIFKYTNQQFNAFLGGISKNYNSNLILSSKPDKAIFAVTEADEFDRSFLQLFPWSAVITSVDEDHLDIYEDIHDLRKTFSKFTGQIHKDGFLVIKKGVEIDKSNFPKNVYTYSLNDEADFYAKNIVNEANRSIFDVVTPKGIIESVEINIPGNLNVENVVAATAIAVLHEINV
ncbi:MAG: UDP-N-acetylmuramate--L-alanine ligase, partial [Chlorobi bacterium]|nr:UDP-N-acetylmuramate--L-alanine ligase [Chlorobiota bacterium]